MGLPITCDMQDIMDKLIVRHHCKTYISLKMIEISSHYFRVDRADLSTLIEPINAFTCIFVMSFVTLFSLSISIFRFVTSVSVMSPVAPITKGITSKWYSGYKRSKFKPSWV